MKYLIVFIIFCSILKADEPSERMLISPIIKGNILTSVTLQLLAEDLEKKGNTISYEVYDNNEVILVVKKVDNLLNKTTVSKIQFNYLEDDKESALILQKGIIDEKVFSANEIYYSIIGPLSNQIDEENQKKAEKERITEINKYIGVYEGVVVEDGDDEDDGEELIITIYYYKQDTYKKLYCKIKYDNEEYDAGEFNINKDGDFHYSYDSIENSKGVRFEFKGKHTGNEINGNTLIEKKKKYPIVNEYYLSSVQGTFKVSK